MTAADMPLEYLPFIIISGAIISFLIYIISIWKDRKRKWMEK